VCLCLWVKTAHAMSLQVRMYVIKHTMVQLDQLVKSLIVE
jgi:hypothetical protein